MCYATHQVMLISIAILVSIMDDTNLCFILDLTREQLLSS